MFDKKAEENRKLIESIHAEMNEMKTHILALEKYKEFSKLLRELKVDIKKEVLREIASTEIAEGIAARVIDKLKSSKVDLCRLISNNINS